MRIETQLYSGGYFLQKRKTYSEKCPVCGGDLHPLGDQTVYFDELPPDTPVLAEVTSGQWVKVVERKPAKT